MRCVSNKYVFIDFEARVPEKGVNWTNDEESVEQRERKRITEEKRKSRISDEKSKGGEERLSVAQTISENREQRVGCLEARVAFTLADINGF